MKHETVAVNEFVLRQIKGSGKTFSSSLTFEKIAEHAELQLNAGYFKKGYREGVVLVQVANELIHHFICPMVKIDDDTILKAEVVRRRPNELPYIQIRATNGDPLETGVVDLILYRHDVLIENDEQSTNSDWELIAFQAYPKEMAKIPMGSITMMRNQLCLSGGTKAKYSSDEWAESIHFWQQYAMMDV